MATYLSRTTLQDRLSLPGLTSLASTTGTITAEDETRITQVLEDISGRIDSVVAGLGIDVNNPPRALQDIALDFAKAELWERVWMVEGLPERTDLTKLAIEAEERLEKFPKGYRVGAIGDTPGQAQVSKFSWRNVADNQSDNNPRLTTRSRMRGLP